MIKYNILVFIVVATLLVCCNSSIKGLMTTDDGSFNVKRDLLLVQFDCKTDVDDLHTMAAFSTLMSDPEFANIQYHAVAGTYGIQEGLYVPPNDLVQLSFGDNWTDAHEQFDEAVHEVKEIAIKTLVKDGDIWIAEAGQSDFTAEVIKAVKMDLPDLNISKRIHVVQHSQWNEDSTSPEALLFVQDHADYRKISDGNIVGNGTPGFVTVDESYIRDDIKDPKLIEVWQLAIDLANQYNGKEGRYDNKAISGGGLDFSDLSEVCYILGVGSIKNAEQFFDDYSD